MTKNIKVDTTVSELLTLCHIIDEYEDFREKLLKFLKTKKGTIDYFLIDKLIMISDNKKCFNAKNVIDFYNENKIVIDKINEYSSLSLFISRYFGVYVKNEDKVEYMYKYLTKNINKLDNIIEVLEKIKELGIKNISFNENDDFTKQTYILPNEKEEIFQYFDNIVPVPNYDSKILKYTTSSSNYKINLSRFIPSISLNNLIFDASRLPQSIDRDKMYDDILKLKEKLGNESMVVNNIVNLSICVDDLNLAVIDASKVVKSLALVNNKKEITKILLNIKNELALIENISTQYAADAVKNNRYITEKLLVEEKILEKNYRS